MDFTYFLPDPRLRTLICRYALYWAHPYEINQRFKCLPTGKVFIIQNLGDPFYIRNPLYPEGIIQEGSMIVGHQEQCYTVEPTGLYKQFTILFYPAGIYRFFGVSIYSLLNNGAPLRNVFGEQISGFPSASKNIAPDTAGQFVERMNRFFLSFSAHHSEYPCVDIALKRIFSTKGMCSVASLAKEAGVSLRHFRRVFRTVCGIHPKGLIRIIRFQAILSILKKEGLTNIDWCEMIFATGYYDQMHFIRDFKAFTGETPSSYLNRISDVAHQFEKYFLAPGF